MIRRLLERLGIIEPPSDVVRAVRQHAQDVNAAARDEVHASRTRRTVIDLDYQLARRRAKHR